MENNYNNDELNKRVLEKLEKKIAISEFIETENKEIKYKKRNWFVGVKVASIVAIVGIIAGNAYTYATYDKDMFSWILDKIGIFEDYKNESKDVNVTTTNNDISLTLTDYGIDSDTLIVGYNLKLKENQEFLEELYDDTKLISGTETFGLENSGMQLFNKVSDTEYVIYKFYNIDATKLSDNISFSSNITIYEHLEEGEEKVLGNWSFDINLEKDKLNLNYEEFAVENKKVNLEQIDKDDKRENIPNVELLEVKKSEITTKLVVLLDGYTTEPSISYFAEVIDEDGNTIVANNIEKIIGGVPTDIIFKKIDFNSKIKINFYEMETESDKVLSKGTMEVDLNKDLKEKEVETTEKITKEWRDLEFEYNEGTEIYQNSYSGNTEDETRDYIDIQLYENIGNEKVVSGNISINCYKNIYKRNLNKVVEELKKLEYLGGYAISNSYTLYLNGKQLEENEDMEEIVLTHEEMMDLAGGKKLSKDGIEFSIEDISIHEVKYQDMQNVKIDDKDTITWIQTYGDTERKYVFLNGDYIYEITCPTKFDSYNDVQDFIDSIKIK